MRIPEASRLLDLVYPPRCVGCGQFGEPLCERCAASLEPATGRGRCPNCSARWEGDANCPRCFGLRGVDGIRCAFEMDGAARRAVHELKYRYARTLAPIMARSMAGLCDREPIDAAFPVPLHRSRQRERGFNQSELLLSHLGWPGAPGLLVRRRKTAQQVGMGPGERRNNVSGAFAYEGPELEGLVIAVIDDVVTTGATIDECAVVLKDHGARQVFGMGFARASYDGDRPILD